MTPLRGIHHVTAITGDAQRNVDFYAGLLALRLVKKTVNFDDPGSYHLYYGDRLGSPGTLITFFAWPGASKGQVGAGEPVALALEIPVGSINWWTKRLADAGVPTERRHDSAAEVASFADGEGLRLELVESEPRPDTEPWLGGGIGKDHAIQGIHSVTLALRNPGVSAALYTGELGFEARDTEGNRHRFAVGELPSRNLIEVETVSGASRSRMGGGSIHHVAFRTHSDDSQGEWLQKLTRLGLHVSPVMDRKYFHSIYFRELGGILFEIATDGPGMTVDETEEQLGSQLALPAEYEAVRASLEPALPPLHSPQLVSQVLSA